MSWAQALSKVTKLDKAGRWANQWWLLRKKSWVHEQMLDKNLFCHPQKRKKGILNPHANVVRTKNGMRRGLTTVRMTMDGWMDGWDTLG